MEKKNPSNLTLFSYNMDRTALIQYSMNATALIFLITHLNDVGKFHSLLKRDNHFTSHPFPPRSFSSDVNSYNTLTSRTLAELSNLHFEFKTFFYLQDIILNSESICVF